MKCLTCMNVSIKMCMNHSCVPSNYLFEMAGLRLQDSVRWRGNGSKDGMFTYTHIYSSKD